MAAVLEQGGLSPDSEMQEEHVDQRAEAMGLWLNMNHFYSITCLQIDFVTKLKLDLTSDVAKGLLSPSFSQ